MREGQTEADERARHLESAGASVEPVIVLKLYRMLRQPWGKQVLRHEEICGEDVRLGLYDLAMIKGAWLPFRMLRRRTKAAGSEKLVAHSPTSRAAATAARRFHAGQALSSNFTAWLSRLPGCHGDAFVVLT